MTNITIPLNESVVDEVKVLPEHSAAHIGSGTVAVLSTPMMILFMEVTARKWLQNLLPNGFTSVGTKVCVEHLAGVKVGETVKTKIVAISQDRKKISFNVEVLLGDKIIGRGSHDRFIVDESKFLEKV